MEVVYNLPLPLELINYIIYKKYGLVHPVSIIINDALKNIIDDENKCWFCKETNISIAKCDKSYISHVQFNPLQKLGYNLIDINKNINLCYICAH